MYLQTVPNLNQLPAELFEKIPELKPGQVAVFRSLKTSEHLDLEKGITTTIFPRLFMSYRDTVVYKNKMYPIGIPRSLNSKGEVESFESEVFGSGYKFSGKISLYGNNMKDREKYMFLMLSNFRKGNPLRSEGYPMLIEYVDLPSESRMSRTRRSVLKSALSIAEALSMREIKDIVCALNLNENQDDSMLRDIVEAYAETNPELFVKSYQSPAFILSAAVKRASDSGIIFWDLQSSKVRWADSNQTVIATLDPDAATNWVRSFAEYCTSNAQGKRAMEEIKKKLKSKEPGSDIPEQSSAPDVLDMTGTSGPVAPGTGGANFDNL